jgi:bile acid:Na+ symporter, BASS family
VLIRPLPLLNFFVAVVMLSIGLRVRGGDLLDILRNRPLFTRTLLANCLLIPAIGFLLVHIFPLSSEARIGILLLAAIPGTPIALQFTRKAKTQLAFAGAMTFVLSVVSVAMTPLAVQVMPETARPDALPVLLLVTNVAFYIALPLAAGVWATRHAPVVAHKLVLPLGILASVVFVFLMWETRLIRAEAFSAIRGGGSIVAMSLLLLLSMLIGWLIGGPGRESRRVLATASGMRGVIVVLYVARYCFPGTNVYMVPFVYLSLMVPTNLVFHLAFTQWNKRWPSERT